jgi:photosynthetic reaction center H subunit
MRFAGSIDIAQLAIWLFWLFFAALVYYLRREDKREGYAGPGDNPRQVSKGWPTPPGPKKFIHRPGH